MCCRGRDHPGSGAVGNWFSPNDTIVIGNSANPRGNFTRSSHYQQIRLNRKRPDVMSPTGVYTCEVPDGYNTTEIHTANITLCECYCLNIYTISIQMYCRYSIGGRDHWWWFDCSWIKYQSHLHSQWRCIHDIHLSVAKV